MGVSSSGFYEWLNPCPSKRAKENKEIQEEIAKVFDFSRGTYGRRRLAAAFNKSEHPLSVSINRVERQMKILDIQGYQPKAKKRTTLPDPLLKDSPNLIKDCITLGIEEIWVSDITYIATREGWLYLCLIMDLHSRRIVGWSLKENMKAELVIEAFKMADTQRTTNKKTVFHSDKGGQYKAKRFRRLLKKKRLCTKYDWCGSLF